MYSWHTRTVKLRGRGHSAPEKVYGADAIFEVEVKDANEEPIARKSLPFQAKKEGRVNRQLLKQQARLIARLPNGGLVVSYGQSGYQAAPAASVFEADGHWDQVPSNMKQPLGEILRDDFLTCRVGSRSLYYDSSRERMLVAGPHSSWNEIKFHVGSRTRTTIRQL
jgi:hypothetical protein